MRSAHCDTISIMSKVFELAKIVVSLRTARAALGWSQEEAANKLGIGKSTIARVETMEGGTTAETLTTMVRAYAAAGVRVDFMFGDDVTITISKKAIENVEGQLNDDTLRRPDRKMTDRLKNLRVEQLRNEGLSEPEIALRMLGK